MPLTIKDSFITFAIIALITAIIRLSPFLLFPEYKETPKYVQYLSKVLPSTIIAMIVIYCLKDVSFLAYPYGAAEIIAIIAIAILHLWKGNTLLSIGGGTLIYMILIQNVF